MRKIRRLDRSRSYGQIFPPLGRKCFAQDHLSFDAAGWCVDDGDPPTPEELKALAGNKGAPKGALSVSGEGDPPPPPPPPEDDIELIPRTSTEWKTGFKFQALRKALMTKKNYNAPNLVNALRHLDSLGLVLKDEE